MKTPTLLVLAATLLPVSPALAQETHEGMDHAATGHGATPSADAPPSRAYRDAMRVMHDGMSAELTGDADRDFLQGMIPHHEGAIAMAKIELEYGQDEKTKALARKVIAAQETEIAEMKAMLEAMK